MRTSFLGRFWESFKEVNGNLIAIVLFIFGVLITFYLELVSSVLLIVVLLLIFSNMVFCNLARKLYVENDFLPKVLRFEYLGSNVICLTEASKVFSFGSIVSMYHKRKGFEKLIAVGEVYNIQEDGKIQVKIHEFKVNKDEIEEIEKKIISNNIDFINDLLVKPNCPKELLSFF